jgi:hypothetical protein
MATAKLDLQRIREAMVANLRPGDRVTILVPSGQHYDYSTGRTVQEWTEAHGRVVIAFGTHAALNMGGTYGKPGVATPENIVRYREARRK